IMEDIRITKRPKQFIVKRENKYRELLTLEITASPLFNDDGKLTDLLIIANDITELEEYRSTLEKALREKEVLLQEVHHRVKNNLAIISGLLELQIMKEGQTKDISLLIEARNRIHSIAMVHEQLYQDMDFSHIHPANYYEKLLTKLGSNALSGGEEIEYDLRFDIDRISINRAVPLGLLINELFTNSIKHAFNSKQQNKVTLHFYEENGRIKVIYSDNGPGFEVDKIRNKNTIGWQLIETLLQQLDSEYELNTDGEFSLEFTFRETTTKSQAVMT
ncbi:MAG: sensor histidine kinase, partial [Balneolales bacterium]|nr:sensor histidine kinase [Balneolales bacterium]